MDRVEKASLNWAKLIARIYEINPLICECGHEIKIITFITHPAEIRRILNKINWPYEIPGFDPPLEFDDWDICQLTPGTEDGFFDDRVDRVQPQDFDDWGNCQLIPGTEDGFPEYVVQDWEDWSL